MPAAPKSTEGGSLVISSIIYGPHFCSMKITEDVRRFAAEQGIAEDEALQTGMEQNARDFHQAGAEIYTKA
jgi:phosphomethylpyrimidine synthase